MKIDAHTLNLLLSLAHLGMADVDQLRRLHFPALAQGTVQNRLTAISDLGLIEQRPWAIGGVRQRSMWVLTAKGQRTIASDPAYPGKPIARSDKLFNHDRRCIDVIVRCIELSRESGLAGAQVVREVRLDRRRARPKADALLFLETRRGAGSVDTVPWAMGLPLKEEQPWRVAIEAETGSQAVKIAAEKAIAYREVYESAEWRQQWTAHYGPPPIVYLVCASTERAAQIATAWRERWPGGHWAITGDEGLVANRWHYHRSGQSRPGTALRFRTREEIAEAEKQRAAAEAKAKREEAERKKAELAAEAEAKRKWQIHYMSLLDQQPPRPLEELIAIVPYRSGQLVEFSLDGRITIKWRGQEVELYVHRFNTAEQDRWYAYHQEQLGIEARADDKRLRVLLRRQRWRRRWEEAKWYLFSVSVVGLFLWGMIDGWLLRLRDGLPL